MSNADSSFFAIAFSIVTVLVWSLRERLKRIEEKLDKISGK